MVTATLKFVETARLDGKLSVKAMNALQGPCLAFKSDAFVAASAELQFANCHNVARLFSRGAEAHGGAMNVRGSLMVMGTLIIRDCGTEDGNGGSLGSNMVVCGFAMLSFRMLLVLQNRLLGGQLGPQDFRCFWLRRLLPSLRCDCRGAGFFPQRKHLHQQFFFGIGKWRCPAPEFLWGRDNLAVACGGSTGSQKRSFERFCVECFRQSFACQLDSLSHGLCSMSCVFHDVPSP